MSYFGVSLRNGIGLGLGTVPSLSSTPLAYRLAPTLTLSFAGATALDPRITFTRASSATFTNSAGLVALSPINLLTYSEQFDNAAWTKNLASVTSDVTVSPSGIVDADKIIEAVGVSDHSVYRNPTLLVNTTYTFSIFAKANTRTKIGIALGFTAYGGISVRAHFNLITGTFITSANSPEAYSIVNVGNNWYKISITKTTSVAGNGSVAVYTLDESGAFTYNGDGTSGLYIWGAQLEAGSTATTYIPTVATATGAARLDYDPVTLQPKGLLIEEARTNLLTYSEQFDNTVWNAATAGVTVTPDNATSPSGNVNADSMLFTGDNSYKYQTVLTGLVTGLTFTYSVWLWSTSGKATIGIRVAGNTTGSDSVFQLVNLTSTPTRYSISRTFTSTDASLGVGFDNRNAVVGGTGATGTIQAWGAQLEAGAFATSYIPTVAAQATRAAETAAINSTELLKFINTSAGTFLAAYATQVNTTLFRTIIAIPSGTPADIRPIYANSSNALAMYDGTNATTGSAFSINQNNKSAMAFGSGTGGICLNGGSITTGTFVSPSSLATASMYIGSRLSAVEAFNGTIASITYWPRRLSNAELQAVTR